MTDELLFTFEADGLNYRCAVKRHDLLFGHGLRIGVSRDDGTLLTTVLFCAHPEHREYDRFQSMSTQELVEIARERLSFSWAADSTREALQAGLQLIFGFSRTG